MRKTDQYSTITDKEHELIETPIEKRHEFLPPSKAVAQIKPNK